MGKDETTNIIQNMKTFKHTDNVNLMMKYMLRKIFIPQEVVKYR